MLRSRITRSVLSAAARKRPERGNGAAAATAAAAALLFGTPLPAEASSAVRGAEKTLESPNGALEHMPGGEYSAADRAMEQ